MPDPDMDAILNDALEAPKKSTGDSGSVEERDIDELIKADRYLAEKKAAANRRPGIRFFKMNPSGTP